MSAPDVVGVAVGAARSKQKTHGAKARKRRRSAEEAASAPPTTVEQEESDTEMAPDEPLAGGRLQLAPGAPHVGTLTVPALNAAVLTHGLGTVTTALETALSRLAFPHWPRASPYRRWHCAERFDAAPWFMFMEQLPNGEWLVSGNFCMVGCVMAWLFGAGFAHERTATWAANIAIIWRARQRMTPEDAAPVPRAPPAHALLEFGGALPLAEFRRQGGYEDVPPECPIASGVLGQPFIAAPSVVQIEEVRGVDAVASAEDVIGWACEVTREVAVGRKDVPLQVSPRARRGERLPVALAEARELLTARFGPASAATIPDAAFVWGADDGGELPPAVPLPAAPPGPAAPHGGGWFAPPVPRASAPYVQRTRPRASGTRQAGQRLQSRAGLARRVERALPRARACRVARARRVEPVGRVESAGTVEPVGRVVRLCPHAAAVGACAGTGVQHDAGASRCTQRSRAARNRWGCAKRRSERRFRARSR
jgi:hypothetical protein